MHKRKIKILYLSKDQKLLFIDLKEYLAETQEWQLKYEIIMAIGKV
tara:strand:- start:153 stop:290 length:138 start_codon:yes stop_codon:yes gene_type:complete